MATKRILVIDDEDTICRVIQSCLEDIAGWQVLLARSGQEGIEIAQTEPLDGILLDISMPIMDGVEVLKHLRSHPVTCCIPVAFLTAKVQPEDRDQFAPLNISGLIIKPFDPIALFTQVAEIFGWV